MALFTQQKKDPLSRVQQLRQQGLTDVMIMDELTKEGFKSEQVHGAISQVDNTAGEIPTSPSQQTGMPSQSFSPAPTGAPSPGANPNGVDGNIYERIEEITEGLIDEKWDELIAEVKKIITWKEKIEDQQKKIISDVEQLKENFTVLHKGVLGKLEQYDTRMQEVGTDLKAVGKVFKDVIPEFVENVKELSSVTKKIKK